jgi:biotin synthase
LIHVALGTANILRLLEGEPLVRPGTAHFMNGGTCAFDCAYCTRARTSQATGDYLCRVPWPAFDENKVYEALARGQSEFSRICLQIVNSERHIQIASRYVEEMKGVSSLPISVEVRTRRMDDVETLLEVGAEYVGLPLDVASDELYPDIRGGSLEADLGFLFETSESFEGRIGTHLIVGLGETEEEMVQIMRKIVKKGIPIGLFAFTPCRGTRMEKSDPPSLSQYRNIQLAKYLLTSGKGGGISFDNSGAISSFGPDGTELDVIPPGIFKTQGCEGCNRPYYNERPVGRPYNYPRDLTDTEYQMELQETCK